jgi:hypothetical protein
MKAIHYLKRALTLPPHIVIKKVVRKLQLTFKAKRKFYVDQKKTTFAVHAPILALHSLVRKIDLSRLPKEKILELNQHFLKHEFNLLGSGWVKVAHRMKGKEISLNQANLTECLRIQKQIKQPYTLIDWHLDFKSGYRWSEDTWSQKIQYGHQLGVDVKVPWELSRMQHLTQLSWGYALEQNGCYKIEFQNQILDFISANPPRYGVNWSCTMDVGIRIANWLIAYDLFRSFGAQFDLDFEAIFIRSVYEHGHHIFHHLEWDPQLRSNHYLANIAGLLFVATYLTAHQEIDSWKEFAIQELEKEVALQFHPDGSNFEGSTSYHRLSTEMALYATALAPDAFSKEHQRRIEKMGEFIQDITKPDGMIVQVGDNDSGRFIKMFPEMNGLDHRYLLGAIGKKDLTSLIEGQLEIVAKVGKKRACYPDFGLYIERQEPWFLAVRAGTLGQKGNGGHDHHDQLSFELSIKGISMIVDPGTYVYTPFPDARRHFRSSGMHNTLSIKGKEQNVDRGLFQLKETSYAKLIEFGEGIFIAEHKGFGFPHRRTLKIVGHRVEGIDECSEEEKEIYFHLAPGWKGTPLNEKQIECSYESLKLVMSADFGIWKIEEREYSKGYGEKECSLVVVLVTHSKATSWTIDLR